MTASEVMLLVCIVGMILIASVSIRAVVTLKSVNSELVDELCGQNHRLSELLESANQSLVESTEHGALVLRDKMRYDIDLARARAFGERPSAPPSDPADPGVDRSVSAVDQWSDTENGAG